MEATGLLVLLGTHLVVGLQKHGHLKLNSKLCFTMKNPRAFEGNICLVSSVMTLTRTTCAFWYP